MAVYLLFGSKSYSKSHIHVTCYYKYAYIYVFIIIYIYIYRTGPKTCISFLVFAVFSCTLSGLFLKAILNLFWIVEYVCSITEANATGQSTGKKRNKRVMPLEFADKN